MIFRFIRDIALRIRAGAKPYIDSYLAGNHRRHVQYVSFVIIGGIIFLTTSYTFFVAPPQSFPVGSLVEIPRGITVSEAADILVEQHAIRSKTAFMVFVRLFENYRGVIAGSYYFDVPQNAFKIAVRMTQGTYDLKLVRVTIPEGATVQEIGDVLVSKLPSFNEPEFLMQAASLEGYLFPDTYFFLPNVLPEEIITTMRSNFDTRLEPFTEAIEESGHSLSDIIIMASMVEKETIEKEDKPIVAGILWKRIEIGMALQVDAPFVYAIGKNSFDLSTADLREDSPYNTYTRRGLTPTPIGNPGLDSIEAALSPIKTPYLFYLSDLKSNIHYARTFEEHKANKEKYLY